MGRGVQWSQTTVFFVVLLTTSALAMIAVDRTFDELVTLSEFVLVGTVESVTSELDPERNRIYTYVTLLDLEMIKGELPGEKYVLRLSGGVVDNVSEVYPGMPQFEEGKRYILFIQGNFHNIFPIVGIHQGVFQVEWDLERQQEVVRPLQGQTVTDVHGGQLRGNQEAFSPPKADLTVEQFVQHIHERLRVLEREHQDNPGNAEPATPASSGGVKP